MATSKKSEPDTGLHGYPITKFRGPNGENDVVFVSSAVTEHNLRAAGYVPAKGEDAPTEADKVEAAEKAPTPTTPTTTTNPTR